MRRTGKTAGLAVALSVAASLAGCGQSPAWQDSAGQGSAGAGRTLTVFAAASLKAPFTALAATFEEAQPGTTVRLSFAGSSDLATQLGQGAPADVFASADANTMAKLSNTGLVEGSPRDFASNVLAIAAPPSNPAGIRGLTDLARPGVKVVICAPQVPCGAATKAVEKAAGVTLKPVSEESSVTDVLGKVTSGEADAGLVYATDVRAAGDKVTGIAFAESARTVNTYPIAVLRSSKDKDLAAAFTALVTGPGGRKILSDAGFGTP
ncbi:molybdate ABC transporter substrate-binding protein [Arthrobacter sp. CG_A4]|uniref:molybdate ABC transporter substrate-binding protein n=1 Tax=Arthrobacter sp. CG_A4 TaxID=3071706 RepID=UPI002DFF4384|nr:molybdate transport system substrate-binding protein [Arthrobacter sp. CG_A4]